MISWHNTLDDEYRYPSGDEHVMFVWAYIRSCFCSDVRLVSLSRS